MSGNAPIRFDESDGTLWGADGAQVGAIMPGEPRLFAPFIVQAVNAYTPLTKLAAEYRPSMDAEVLHAWAADVVAILAAESTP